MGILVGDDRPAIGGHTEIAVGVQVMRNPPDLSLRIGHQPQLAFVHGRSSAVSGTGNEEPVREPGQARRPEAKGASRQRSRAPGGEAEDQDAWA